ncbi:ATP-dependent DNA helicase pif1-like [Tripterygium wilfordii]|uniref:ATP-dependent DNA helicase pif1-like n=1 Tax=Tripterygium wilfordii TaxID=458696 RepID=UPI0018F83859|nr:ATP-dependent DNA helicase pif1-like [Tripterygium wilfordii]
MHRYCFEAIDRTLQDILNINDNEENCKPFGGKTVLLGGDFRQIISVVVNGTRYDTVNASITKSHLWKRCKVLSLKQNMRLQATGHDGEENPSWIKIPDELLHKSNGDLLDSIIAEIYDNLENSYNNTKYLNKRAITTDTNDIVAMINTRVLALLQTDERTYYSFDSVCKTSKNSIALDMLYTTEVLNLMTFNGILNHELTLKKYAPIILLRNLNQVDGLCNGTRLLVTHLGDKVIKAKVLSCSNVGDNLEEIFMQEETKGF